MNLDQYQIVEPSTGEGSFLAWLPTDSIGFDIDPKHPGIRTADFLTVRVSRDRGLAFVGNPPFGKNASLAVRFFNHAALDANIIAFIVPRNFKKRSIIARLDHSFHLIDEMPIPKDAFIADSKPRDVPAVFQIWERHHEQRPRLPHETTHPDFKFVTAEKADFAI